MTSKQIEGNTMKHKNKYTFLMNWLEKEPLKYSDMNRLLKSVKLNNKGFYEITKEFKNDKWRTRTDYGHPNFISKCKCRASAIINFTI